MFPRRLECNHPIAAADPRPSERVVLSCGNDRSKARLTTAPRAKASIATKLEPSPRRDMAVDDADNLVLQLLADMRHEIGE